MSKDDKKPKPLSREAKLERWYGWVMRPVQGGGFELVHVLLPAEVVARCRTSAPEVNTRAVHVGKIEQEVIGDHVGRLDPWLAESIPAHVARVT